MFITLEGPEGSGKSSQINMLADYLRQKGVSILVTREPGGTPIGDQIRRVVHDVGNVAMTPQTEMLLYSASRAQLVAEVIRPALAAGQLVLCDRFYDSTIAYQGYGRGLDLADLYTITRFATGGLKPDLTLLLDLPVAEGLSRRAENGLEMNRLDRETISFHQRVRQGYKQMAAQEPERWVVVDAARPLTEVQKELRRIITKQLDSFGM